MERREGDTVLVWLLSGGWEGLSRSQGKRETNAQVLYLLYLPPPVYGAVLASVINP